MRWLKGSSRGLDTLLIKSAVEMRNIKVVLLKKEIPLCFVLNEKEQPKCMNGSDHFIVRIFKNVKML